MNLIDIYESNNQEAYTTFSTNEVEEKDLYQEPNFCKTFTDMNYIANGGADTIHLSLKVKWGRTHQQYLEAIEKIKDDYKMERKDGESVAEFINKGHLFEVQPYGSNTGDSRYSYYPNVLKENGTRYLLSERDFEKCTASGNVSIQIGSKALMKWGEDFCFNMAMDSIKSLGGKIKECKISRIDLCADLPNMTCENLQTALFKRHYVCRAKTLSEFFIDGNPERNEEVSGYHYGYKKTGFVIGKSGISFRLYDKLHESRFDEEKLCLLVNNRYGGEMPETAIRAEFQLRGKTLRNIQVRNKCESIDTWEDYKLCKADIIDYLTHTWLRVYSHAFDKNHTDRLSEDDLHDDWVKIQEAFQLVAGQKKLKMEGLLNVTEDAKPIKGYGRLIKVHTHRNKVPTFERLNKQALGCLLSIMAGFGTYIENPLDIIFHSAQALEKTLASIEMDDLQKRLHKKRLRYTSNNVIHNDNVPF